MAKSFRCVNRKEAAHCGGAGSEKARHLHGAQAPGFVLERVQFLCSGITVFHAGNIGAARCMDKR